MFQIELAMTDADSSNDLTAEAPTLAEAAAAIAMSVAVSYGPEAEWMATFLERVAELIRMDGEGTLEVKEWDFASPENGYFLRLRVGRENFVTH